MGNCLGSAGGGGDGAGLKDDLQRGVDTTSRIKGFTQGRLNTPLEQAGIPKNAQLVDPKYFPPLEESMDNLLVFKDMPRAQKRKVRTACTARTRPYRPYGPYCPYAPVRRRTRRD